MCPEPQDAIMEEVDKLNQLIADCCPEVFDNRFSSMADDADHKEEADALGRHRRNILSEAAESKKTR
jgi:hypothetical protein